MIKWCPNIIVCFHPNYFFSNKKRKKIKFCLQLQSFWNLLCSLKAERLKGWETQMWCTIPILRLVRDSSCVSELMSTWAIFWSGRFIVSNSVLIYTMVHHEYLQTKQHNCLFSSYFFRQVYSTFFGEIVGVTFRIIIYFTLCN